MSDEKNISGGFRGEPKSVRQFVDRELADPAVRADVDRRVKKMRAEQDGDMAPPPWWRRLRCAVGWHHLDAFWSETGHEALVGCRFCPVRFRNVRGDWVPVSSKGLGEEPGQVL